jgi:ring-1,2-phenylacetyl-CoA epoxidase subunit PaaC
MPKELLLNFVLHLADDSLILGHRNSEWCGHGPELEQDIAITNIALDLIGQARNFYQYAATIKGSGSTEDTIAYLRDVREFKNCLLVEQANGDWAQTILRQFFVSVYQFYLYTGLQTSTDAQMAAIAVKSLKEVTYHVRWASEWVIRLGDGTDESRNRMIRASEVLWMYTGEMFQASDYERAAAEKGIGIDVGSIKTKWEEKVRNIFNEATLPYPRETFMQTGGKEGRHTEQLGFILAELQFLQRAYPNLNW